MPFKEEKVSVRNGMFNTTVRRSGSGAPLVYMHAAGPPTWDAVHDLLAEHFEVIQPHHPGWPGSEGFDHLDDVIDMSLYYLDLFDAMGLRDINLVGTSLGGMFAAEIAALGPSVRLEARARLARRPLAGRRDAPRLLHRLPGRAGEGDVGRPGGGGRPHARRSTRRTARRRPLRRSIARWRSRPRRKFVWPIWDKGLKRRIHRIKAPTLLDLGRAGRPDPAGLRPGVPAPDPRLQARGDERNRARPDDREAGGVRGTRNSVLEVRGVDFWLVRRDSGPLALWERVRVRARRCYGGTTYAPELTVERARDLRQRHYSGRNAPVACAAQQCAGVPLSQATSRRRIHPRLLLPPRFIWESRSTGLPPGHTTSRTRCFTVGSILMDAVSRFCDSPTNRFSIRWTRCSKRSCVSPSAAGPLPNPLPRGEGPD